jgi:hypothetical protein
MPAEFATVYSAAQLKQFIDELRELQPLGLGDVTEGVAKALQEFDMAPCETHADALAFISMSRLIVQSIVRDLMQGKEPGSDLGEAADRYMETAVAFLQAEDARRTYGHFGGHTLH